MKMNDVKKAGKFAGFIHFKIASDKLFLIQNLFNPVNQDIEYQWVFLKNQRFPDH